VRDLEDLSVEALALVVVDLHVPSPQTDDPAIGGQEGHVALEVPGEVRAEAGEVAAVEEREARPERCRVASGRENAYKPWP